jgi:hypothetical protein
MTPREVELAECLLTGTDAACIRGPVVAVGAIFGTVGTVTVDEGALNLRGKGGDEE